jgi:hypothetical protein
MPAGLLMEPKFQDHAMMSPRVCRRHLLVAAAAAALIAGWPGMAGARADGDRDYVGSAACQSCHEREYRAFGKYAKKNSSFQSIVRLRKELTEEEVRECYFCHTTGYGKPGGFISEESTPELKNAGCEVCHGPGGLHVKTQAREHIKGHLTEQDCEVCHTSERVKAFRYKPLIRGGAH